MRPQRLQKLPLASGIVQIETPTGTLLAVSVVHSD